jgi:DNA polymerase-1
LKPSKKRYVFDIEADGLLDTVSQIWMLAATDVDSGEKFFFTDHNDDHPSLEEGKAFMYDANMLIGHNIIEYDIPALEMVLGWKIPDSVAITDTVIMSRVLDYNRFAGRHALALFGDYFERPKPEHEDWENYSPEMEHRCKEDVEINRLAYELLIKEMQAIASKQKKPYIKQSLRNEHDVVKFCFEAEQRGWLFDKSRGLELIEEMEEEMMSIEKAIEPQLKTYVKAKGNVPADKLFKKGNGDYFLNICKYFDIDTKSAHTDRMVDGEFTKIITVHPDMGSLEYVKAFLESIGWEPLEYNWKKVKGRLTKTSPKLCERSLEALGDTGKMIDTYYTTRSRHSILQGWLSDLDENDRLHGRCFTIGTPTARARHSTIVNVPSPNATWGKEMRELFIVEEGRVIVGSDSSGNQMRALCHYLNNEAFTQEVINGDVHQRNADILNVERFMAKPFLYAFLFGGGVGKLGLILSGVRDAKLGRLMKDKFIEKTPGLGELIGQVSSILQKTSGGGKKLGYIPALDGRKIYTDSDHKALNYLLQSCEAVTCKAAVALMMKYFKEEELDVKPLIFYHDEVQLDVAEKDSKRVAELAAKAFREAPKQFGVDIMDGESMIGNTWYDTH